MQIGSVNSDQKFRKITRRKKRKKFMKQKNRQVIPKFENNYMMDKSIFKNYMQKKKPSSKTKPTTTVNLAQMNNYLEFKNA